MVPGTVSANTFGARGDGTTLCTAAIQAAINEAQARSGTVAFDPGIYLTGAVFVKSGVTLRLNNGVTLLGSRDVAAYPIMPTRVAGVEMPWPAALINVYREKNVRLEGEGTIDGDGKIWWDAYWRLRRDYDPRGLRWAADYDCQRPRLIQIFESSNVSYQNLDCGDRVSGPSISAIPKASVWLTSPSATTKAAVVPAQMALISTPPAMWLSKGPTSPAMTTPSASRRAAIGTACAWRGHRKYHHPQLHRSRRRGRRDVRQRDVRRIP